jgi:hypothetical protein
MTFVITPRKILFGMIIFLTLISEVNAQTWVLTGNMAEQRARHSAVLLCDGRVLVLGSAGHAELYDPGTRTFTPTGTMNTTGYEATATRLLDCRVLVVGGNAGTGTGSDPGLDAAEIYNPATGTFTLTSSLSVRRKRHAAVLLQGGPQDGRVLITGGNGTDFEFYASTEIFDPQANGGVGAFIPGGTMSRARGGGHTATRLLDGRVLIAGGSSCPCPTPADPADIYDPTTGMWSITGPTQEGIAVHTATLLGNGKVLIAGGGSGGGPLTVASADVQAQWDFAGDGAVDQVTAALTTSFPFTTAGTFHPSVTVMDNSGATATAATTVTIETTTQAINDLITSVQGLSSLNTGQKNSLISKLNAVSDAINRANLPTACNQLGAFINEVNAQLDQATANNLIGAAQSIKTAIECS